MASERDEASRESGPADPDAPPDGDAVEPDRSPDGDAADGGPTPDGDTATPARTPEPADAGAVAVESAEQLADLREHNDHLLVQFYADWCAPSVVDGSIVGAVADETPAAVATVDVEVNADAAAEHNVRSVPTTVLFVDGQPVRRLVGLQREEALVGLVERYVDRDDGE